MAWMLTSKELKYKIILIKSNNNLKYNIKKYNNLIT